MKKLIALTVLAAFVASNNDAMAATKKKKVKRNSSAQMTTTTSSSSSSVEQKVSSQQAAVSETGIVANPTSSKFSMKYLADLGTSLTKKNDREANKYNGYSLVQELSGAYAVTANDKLSLTARVDQDKNETLQADGSYNKTEETTFNRIYLTYNRTSILTEADHGIDLTAGMHFRYLPDASVRSGNADGLIRPVLSFTKTLGNFSTNVGLYRAFFVRSKDEQQADYYNYVTIAPSYQLTEKLSLGMLVEYIKQYDVEGATQTETTDLAASVSYAFTPKVSGDFYVDSDGTMVPGDAGDLFAKDWSKRLNIGTTFTFSIL
jgi:hypothetical protein